MSDIFHKKIQILKLLPKAPARISAREIHHKLTQLGFQVHKRTVQRDLNDLAKLFSIENDGNKDIPGWSWQKGAIKLELPEMDTQVALSFQMVKTYLRKLMPPSVLSELSDYFINADKVLSDNKNRLTHWPDKIATLSRTQPLLAPDTDPTILTKVYWALLSDTQLQAVYQPRNRSEKEYLMHPLGLVAVDQILYLVATAWDAPEIKQFALHRFIWVENTEDKITRPSQFNLHRYIERGYFQFLVCEQEPTIELQLKLQTSIAKHLSETPLSKQQTLIKVDDHHYQLTAKVTNTQQLRWWILGFGAGVEVLQPMSLRQEIHDNLTQTLAHYQ